MLALLPSSYRTRKIKFKQSFPWRFKFFPICARAGMSDCRGLPVKVRIHVRTHMGKVTCVSEEVAVAEVKL